MSRLLCTKIHAAHAAHTAHAARQKPIVPMLPTMARKEGVSREIFKAPKEIKKRYKKIKN